MEQSLVRVRDTGVAFLGEDNMEAFVNLVRDVGLVLLGICVGTFMWFTRGKVSRSLQQTQPEQAPQAEPEAAGPQQQHEAAGEPQHQQPEEAGAPQQQPQGVGGRPGGQEGFGTPEQIEERLRAWMRQL